MIVAVAVTVLLTGSGGAVASFIKGHGMSALSKLYKTSDTKENEGVRVEVGEAEPGKMTSFVIARAGKSNKRYTKELERATRPYRRSIELETIDPKVADSVYMGVWIETCLLGWENVPAADVTGNEADTGYAPFNPANARKLFENLPELFEDLNERSKKVSLFRDEQREGDAGN